METQMSTIQVGPKIGELAKCRCRKELDSPWSWLVCLSATFIIMLTLGTSLNFGVLFPVLMHYFQESRERIGKSIDNSTYLTDSTV